MNYVVPTSSYHGMMAAMGAALGFKEGLGLAEDARFDLLRSAFTRSGGLKRSSHGVRERRNVARDSCATWKYACGDLVTS